MSSRVWVATIVLCCYAASCPASVVSVGFAGTIIDVDDPNSLLGGSVSLGMSFSGSFAYETSTLPSYVDPTGVRYDGALLDFRVTLGGNDVVGAGSSNRVIVYNDSSLGDALVAVADPRQFAGRAVVCGLLLRDLDADIFSSLALPPLPPPLSQLEEPTFSIMTSLGGFGILGTVISLTPEPSSLLLLAGGVWLVVRRSGRGGLGREMRRSR